MADAVQAHLDRIGDLLTEIDDRLARLTRMLDAAEAKADHAQIVGQLTDERFRTVTR